MPGRTMYPPRDEAKAKKLADAEARASGWLADGNVHKDNGNIEKAERCYEKAQFWLDRANKIRGFG